MNTSALSRRDALKLAATTAAGLAFAGSRSFAQASSSSASAHALTLGVASYTLRQLQVDAVLSALEALDIKSLALHRAHLPWDGTPDECRAVAQRFRDKGISLVASGVVNFSNDEAASRKSFENAKAIGLPVITCKPSIDSFPLLDRLVKEYDIRLAIHNHGPEDNVYPSPLDAWKAVQPFDARIGLCIDVGHTARAGDNVPAVIRTCAARLYDVHFKDSLAVPGARRDVPVEVGRGQLDIRGMLTALKEIRYAQVVNFEYEKATSNPIIGLAESVGYVRGMLASMG
jgi:sugar phosphate isomerase/epimerase